MRAVVMRDHKLVVENAYPDPEPGPGEVLVRTLACGICGSDLHALKHAEKLVENAREAGSPYVMDLARDIVMGHEFCAEVLDYGPSTPKRFATGTRVVSMPILMRGMTPATVGYSNEFPGGYGERMILNDALLLPVPNGLSTERAALTEPMAVGLHAVVKGNLAKSDAPLVVGCGPVGLAVIAALKLRGFGPIVAADFSPMRRGLAEKLGADHVVDPRQTSAYAELARVAAGRTAVIFECVGVPGMLQRILKDAPIGARVVVAGVCMEDDLIRPMLAISKEINLQFVLGYLPNEFADSLNAIADGKIDVAPLITGRVGLDKVAWAFDELGHPDAHAKIVVEPARA
jgi:threonine dehydrogenase-like Zn-dependent dehydrogenase